MAVLLTYAQHASEPEKIVTSHSLSFYIKTTSAQHHMTRLYVALHTYIHTYIHTYTYTHIHSINPVSASNMQLDIEHVNKTTQSI